LQRIAKDASHKKKKKKKDTSASIATDYGLDTGTGV
jgi:hypothetical protein